MRQAAYEMIHKLEEMEKEGKGQPPPNPSKEEGDQRGKTLSSHLRLAVDKVFDYVDHTNFATLGGLWIKEALETIKERVSSKKLSRLLTYKEDPLAMEDKKSEDP